MNMVIFYFSGTGNSKFIAELFAEKMDCQCLNIEEQKKFAEIIDHTDIIAFCYPIYGSRPPRLMREFVTENKLFLNGKRLIIFCTQMLGSGDGARCLTDLLSDISYTVIYAEHFLMPNNINNLFFLPIASDKKNNDYYSKARKRMEIVCQNIKSGKIVRRGFHTLSKWLGLMQGAFMPALEEKGKNLVHINENCTQCGICVNACPLGNLKLSEDGVTAGGNCMMCYRCTNLCPQKAIKVLLGAWPKKQYLFGFAQSQAYAVRNIGGSKR